MKQWQGDSRWQSKILKHMCDISQLEHKANKRTDTGSSVKAPTPPHSVQNLSEENVEQIRKTMIRHAELFKEQVLALHKLYNIQRSLMHEIQKVAHFQAKCCSLSMDAFQIEDNQASGSATNRIAFELGSGHISDHTAENATGFGVIHKIISNARHTGKEFAKRHNALRAEDKVVIDSAVRKSTIRRSLDLERPPEDYMDDQETESTEAERSSVQGTQLFSEALHNLSIHLEHNEKVSSRIGVEEKTANGMLRQLFRTEPRGLSQKNQIDKKMSAMWIRSADDGIHWPAGTELATIVQEGCRVSLPESVQAISGRKWLSKQESKMDLEISSQKGTSIEHSEEWRKARTELSNELSQTNALLTSTVSHESDSTQKSSCRQVSAFTRLEEGNQVGSSKESFGSQKEISSSSKDIKLSGTLPTVVGKDLNKEAEYYTGLSRIQNVLIRQPAVAESRSSVRTSQTMAETTCEEIAQENVQVSIPRDTNQFSSVIFPQGYLDGATIPAFGSQSSLEGHPALASQGFLFPTFNNGTVMGPVPYLASSPWYPQNSYFQLYHYHQQAAQDQGFWPPIQGFQQTWTHNRQGREDRKNDISGEPASLPTCFRPSADLSRQSQEGTSSVNWHSGSPQLQELKFAPQKSHLKKPPELVVADDDLSVDLKLATQEDQSGKYSGGQIPTAIKDPDVSKLYGTQEKTLINERVSICSKYPIEFLEGKEHKEEETNISPKIELQDTNITTKKQTIVETSHGEYSAVEGVPLSQKREPNMLLDKKAETGAISLGNQHSDEQLPTTLWMQGKQAQPSESSHVEVIMSTITRQEMLLPSLYKDDISFRALETKNYASTMLSSNVSDRSLHKEEACKDSDHMENHKVLYPNWSLQCNATNGLANEKEENNDDPRSSGVEPLRLNQKECTWIERRSHSDVSSSKDSTSSVLQRDMASGKPLEHQHVTKEAHSMVTTHNDNYHNSLASRIVVGEQHAVEKVESLPGMVSMENTQTDKLRLSQQDEHVTKRSRDVQSPSQDLQTRQGIHAQNTSIQTSSCRRKLELQGNHSRMETVSLEEDLSEATESAQESSTNSKGSEANSEEEAASEEACEKLAARTLLSLAPSASPYKNKSMTNDHSLHQFQSPKLTGFRQPEQFDFTSIQAGQMENRSHAVGDPITIPCGKSIREKRHQTQHTGSQFTSLGNHQSTSV